MPHILVIEDEDSYREPLVFNLQRDGFTVSEASDGPTGLAQATSQTYDLVLLDLMLPGLAGTEVCRAVRQVSSVPIIMLTAKDDVIDRVVGLELGADDYLTKPYSYRELLARIQAVLRRTRPPTPAPLGSPASAVAVGDLEVDEARHEVRLAGRALQLPLREFELLAFLAAHVGQVLTRAQLLDRLWGVDYFGDSKTLDVHVKRLRAKIEADPSQPRRLLTVRGVGYRLVAP